MCYYHTQLHIIFRAHYYNARECGSRYTRRAAIHRWYKFHMTPIRMNLAISHRTYHDICDFNGGFVQNWKSNLDMMSSFPGVWRVGEALSNNWQECSFSSVFPSPFSIDRLKKWINSGLLKQNKLPGQQDVKDQTIYDLKVCTAEMLAQQNRQWWQW